MAGSTRAELASSGLEGTAFASAYPNGSRGAYSGSSLERSGSFRDSLENRMLISGSVISRNAPQTAETPPLSQYLTLDLFSTSELKCVRSGELRRVLGISVEDQSFGSAQSKALPPISWEELKRFKGGVQETHNKARERAKLCQEQILKLDKYRNIVSKKRQRNEIQASEKSGASNLLKIGSQLHQNSSDLLSQRPEERTKNLVPNKRVRSSMVEVRSEGRSTVPARQGATIEKDKMIILDKDKNMLRACNGGTTASEDKMRGLPAGGDGWEKKLKRKRSVGTMVARATDSDRELKQVIQQRPNTETRPRSCDGLGFRTGSSNSIIGNSKLDGSSQLIATGSRIMPRGDLDNGCLSSERRERSAGPDKERFVAKGSSKLNIREDALAGNQSPVAKGKASRAPRTALGAAMNTHNFSRSSGGVDGWEQPPSLNKVQPLTGAVNRKRPLPTGSSSAVAQWVGQRPQKISRTRRANVISPVSNFDESQALPEGFAASDAGASRLTCLEPSGILPSRGTPNNSHQIKMKLENVPSPAGLSESEESAATENKSKEKGIDNGEVEDAILNAANRAATFVLPTKKNKLPLKEEIGDGVRRQGRSGRGMVQPKAGLPVMKEKLENIDSTKPLKGGRSTSDKTESRVGRPPSKKVSDRKAYTRPGQITSSELTGGESDDDREELLAAANAARTASYTASSSPFWKKMEPLFAFVGSEELNFVKHQICFAEELDESLSKLHDADQNSMGELMFQSAQSSQTSFSVEQQVSQTNVVRLKMSGGTMHSVDEAKACGKVEPERWFEKIIPLSQRLLSAFISEDGIDGLDCSTEQMDPLLQFSSDFSPYGADSHVENEHEADLVKSEFLLDIDLKSQKNKSGDNLRCNGSATSSSFRSPDIVIHGDELLQENDDVVLPDTRILTELRQANPNQPQAASTGLSETTYESSFEHISLDDRILMELHSIGIYPEIVPDLAEGEDEEINKVVSELKILLYEQVRKKKSHLCQLERAIEEGKKYEERSLEHLAMNKLVEMAYKRLLGGRGSHGSSHKSGVSKVSKQLALAFAKRTLARCQKFEEGQSCFNEPVLRDVLSAPLNSDAKFVDGITSGISHKVNVESRSGQFGSRLSASGAVISAIATNMVERHGLNLKLDSPFQAASHMPDQAFVKNDPISNRGKKREALLDDVVTGAASRVTTPSLTLPGNTKWKRTDKDRDQNKDSLIRNSAAKAGRPSSSTGRGERKTKAKPKQKIAQLSTSGNGLGRVTETTHFVLPMQESFETANSGSSYVEQEVGLPRSANITENLSKELDDTIFTNLPLQGIDSIDELDVADGLGGQGQDIGSWLNVVDEDVLQDNDLMGLEIPMDDLSELTLNF